MDKLNHYRQLVQQLMLKYAAYKPASGDIEVETIFDNVHDHYQLVNVGWENETRIHGCPMHIDIKNSKVWIQHNGTEIDIGEELIEMGIAREDIILGFHPSYMRQFTQFASK
jgi:hypothetical protein